MPEDDHLERWRGRVDAQIDDSTRRLNALNGDLRSIKDTLGKFGADMATLQVSSAAARDEQREHFARLAVASEANADELNQIKTDELESVKKEIRNSRRASRNTILALTSPLLAGLAGGIIALIQHGGF